MPSNTTTYTLSAIQNALTAATGAVPYLGCSGTKYNATHANSTDAGYTTLDEVWYYMHVSSQQLFRCHFVVQTWFWHILDYFVLINARRLPDVPKTWANTHRSMPRFPARLVRSRLVRSTTHSAGLEPRGNRLSSPATLTFRCLSYGVMQCMTTSQIGRFDEASELKILLVDNVKIICLNNPCSHSLYLTAQYRVNPTLSNSV